LDGGGSGRNGECNGYDLEGPPRQEVCQPRIFLRATNQPSISAIGAITHQSGRIEMEAIYRALDHAFGGKNLCLPDRRGALDVYNDRVLDIDHIVGGIGEEGLPTIRTCN
jgi:hypothetical protein